MRTRLYNERGCYNESGNAVSARATVLVKALIAELPNADLRDLITIVLSVLSLEVTGTLLREESARQIAKRTNPEHLS